MRRERKPHVAVLGTLVMLGLAVTGVRAATPRSAAPAETMMATVKAVDADGRGIEVMTGTGHALRVRRVEVPAGLEIKAAAGVSQRTLSPGCVVRIECGHGGPGVVATKLTIVRAPARRGTP